MQDRIGVRMKLGIWSAGLGILIFLIGTLGIFVTRNDTIIARGSDSLTEIFRPPLWSQIFALLWLTAAVGLTSGLDRRYRAALILAGVATIAMSMHFVVLSGRDDTIREVLGVWTVRTVPLGPPETRTRRLLSQRGTLFIRYDDGIRRVDIFVGLPPWRIDSRPIISHPLLNPPSV